MLDYNIQNDLEKLRDKVGLKLIEELANAYSDVVKEIWIPMREGAKIRKNKAKELSIIGVDGSVNRAKVRVATIFMVRAVGIETKPKHSEIFTKKEKMGIVKYPKLAKERTILYMEGLEAELYDDVTSSSNFNSIMLMDGMFSVASDCANALRIYGCEDFTGSLNELLSYEATFNGDPQELIRVECGWKKERYKQVALKAKDIKTIYVAKTYRDNTIFGHPEIYDIEILDLIAPGKGMTEPFTKTIKVGCKNKIEATLTTSYMRFSNNGSIYFVEILGKLSREEVENIYYILERYSIAGYPLPLRLAHRRAEIPDKVMRILINRIGGILLKSGREAL